VAAVSTSLFRIQLYFEKVLAAELVCLGYRLEYKRV
jgi:hypothetical protein